MIDLQDSIDVIAGIGPRRGAVLSELGIRAVGDLIRHLPRAHKDFRGLRTLAECRVGERVVVRARVKKKRKDRRFGARRGKALAEIEDETGSAQAVWFGQSYVADAFHAGVEAIFAGKVGEYKGKLQILSPVFECVDPDGGEMLALGRIAPVYSLPEDIPNGLFRRLVRTALDGLGPIPDPHDEEFLRLRGMPDLGWALRRIHFPEAPEDLARARERLAYDELLVLELGMALRRRQVETAEAAFPIRPSEEAKLRIARMFPFEFTAAQKRVVGEILRDMAGTVPMNRLLQGDVGSGKTAVALCAAAAAIEGGRQVAVMVPTEILADQHVASAGRFLKDAGVRIVKLSGGLGASGRRDAIGKISSGRADLVIGTHAVIQKAVGFLSLGLVIIDEQHKFGVIQRSTLLNKGKMPHVMVMTATPIPRTLALTVYGDLDVSVIDELPPGRKPVETAYLPPGKRAGCYEIVREEVRAGGRGYIVCPIVEESEDADVASAVETHRKLSAEVFPELSVGLIHGRLPADEKERAMRSFASGRTQVLVATVVIEVGVDVPEASVMIVEHAERFGLAQLHQLRGRIGRGRRESRMFLFARPRSAQAVSRLKAFAKIRDGFDLAEEDLKLRGPGEFFGLRQHGLPELKVADLAADIKLVSAAREDAFEMVRTDPELLGPRAGRLRALMEEAYGGKLALAGVG